MKIVKRVVTGGRNEDRAAHCRTANGAVLVVADGAGNSGLGARAAETVVAMAGRPEAASLNPSELLAEIDRSIAADSTAGEATGVVVILHDRSLHGASVGDSGAWLLARDDIADLTQRQARKPLLGSGMTQPVGFGPIGLTGRLLMATDGLFKYVAHHKLEELALHTDIEHAADALCDAARLANGELPDDIGLLLVDVQT